MLEIKEQENPPVEENNPPEVNKYHKRIDDLIEDAEIEAEIEAEKNIRSKNSRMFSISMIGICLLGLVYFQINYQAALSPVEPEAPIQKPETPEESLAKQVPVVEDGSIASNLPIAPTASPGKVKKEINPFVAPPKPKRIIVNHGENSKCLDLASSAHKALRIETNAPRNLDALRLK